MVRAGLRQILAGETGVKVIAEAADGDELVAKLAAAPVNVLLLDVTMPGAPFPTLLKFVRTTYPQLRVLVLSMQPEDQFAVRALRQGAAGYLTKERSPQELLEAIRKIVRGGKYVSPALAERLAVSLERGHSPLGEDALSEREYQVLRLIGAGKSVGEIASALGLSPKTVSTYRGRLLAKMGFTSNADLVKYVVANGLM